MQKKVEVHNMNLGFLFYLNYLRKQQVPKMSQRILADRLQLKGIDVDKNAIQRIESGERFVTDIELKVLAEIFNMSADNLLQ